MRNWQHDGRIKSGHDGRGSARGLKASMSESQNSAPKPGVGSRHASAAAGSCSTVEADQGAWPRRVGTDVAPADREGPAQERPASRKDALSSPRRSHLVNCNGMDGAGLPCGRLGRRWQHEGLSTRRQGEGHRSRNGLRGRSRYNIVAASDGDCHRAWHTHRLLWLSVALVLSPC
jgi:hypothetical protein